MEITESVDVLGDGVDLALQGTSGMVLRLESRSLSLSDAPQEGPLRGVVLQVSVQVLFREEVEVGLGDLEFVLVLE